jgi:hypothetical protein
LNEVGLVPLSYKKFSFDYHIYGVDGNKARDILGITEKFFHLLENTPPYNFYMKLLSYPLPIPFNREQLAELKSNLTDMNTFEAYLENRATMADMIDNFDY